MDICFFRVLAGKTKLDFLFKRDKAVKIDNREVEPAPVRKGLSELDTPTTADGDNSLSLSLCWSVQLICLKALISNSEIKTLAARMRPCFASSVPCATFVSK